MFRNNRTPLYIFLLTFILGLIGFILNQSLFADYEELSKQQIDKLLRVMQLVKYYYVEDVEWNKAVEGAITGMLSELDPHSVYIEPQKVEKNKEDLSGK